MDNLYFMCFIVHFLLFVLEANKQDLHDFP